MSDYDDSWTIATADDDGKPVIFRIRSAPPAFVRKAQFPHLLAISWPFEPASEGGMPSEDDVGQMSDFEDRLVPVLEEAGAAFLSVVATGNGVREWQWYGRDPEQVMELVNQALDGCQPFPIQISADNDPNWEAYTRFTDGLSPA